MSRVFELSEDRNGEFHVIIQDLPNLELMILFTGEKRDCECLLDALQFAESKGMIRGNTI
jgi:hypothetical protein